MRPKERRDSGQNDRFRARFDQIVDLGHLAKLAATIDWRFLEGRSIALIFIKRILRATEPSRFQFLQ